LHSRIIFKRQRILGDQKFKEADDDDDDIADENGEEEEDVEYKEEDEDKEADCGCFGGTGSLDLLSRARLRQEMRNAPKKFDGREGKFALRLFKALITAYLSSSVEAGASVYLGVEEIFDFFVLVHDTISCSSSALTIPGIFFSVVFTK
jgi:hypothetical protein